jgi:hypothetical protein
MATITTVLLSLIQRVSCIYMDKWTDVYLVLLLGLWLDVKNWELYAKTEILEIAIIKKNSMKIYSSFGMNMKI